MKLQANTSSGAYHLGMANTPWGELPVGDAHVHFFSPDFYVTLARQKGLETAQALRPLIDFDIPTDTLALSVQWVRALDVAGVSRAALIASVPNDEASVTAAVAQFPDRFYGYFMVDPQQPDLVSRIEAAAQNRHLHAMCLFPAMHRVPITDARLIPVLELAAQHHLTVFVHCGALTVGIRKKLGLPNPFDMRLSNPLDLHPVASAFPQVRFVVPHFGAGMLREALMLADLCPNVWLDTSSTNRWMGYEGLDLRSVFRRVIDVLGTERLLFGTDSSFFPRGWHTTVFDAQVKSLYELGLEAPAARQILGGNLVRLHQPRVEAMKVGR